MKTTFYALLVSLLFLPTSPVWTMQFVSDCFSSLDESDSAVYKTGMYLFQQASNYAQEYRNAQLFKAIERNEPESLLSALKKGAHINARNCDGKTPLINSIEASHPFMTAAILKNNPDINQQVAPSAKRQAGMVPVMFALDKAGKTNPKDPYAATAVTLLANPLINLQAQDAGGRNLEYWAKNKPVLQQRLKILKNQPQRIAKVQPRLITIKPVTVS